MALQGIAKDFEFARPLDGELAWLHRRTTDGTADFYYVANLTDRAQAFDARFRAAGREAELWRPMTGQIEAASYAIETEKDRTTVPLQLGAREAVFVVFRKPTTLPTRTVGASQLNPIATLQGPWELTFPEHLGAPARVQLASLQPWSAHADEGVKYFSGTATYTKNFEATREWFVSGAQLLLDLGTVGDIAEVTVNGRALGIVWAPPYRVDLADALKPGPNRLEIKVTNQWTNRIVGDRSAPPEKKVLNVPAAPGPGGGGFGGGQTLPVSGLLGPVTLVSRSH
jgi:hypothetical protein